MPKFFIERPIFAWVIAIFVVIAGLVSITKLPVSQYPAVAPPTIRVMVTYPGATAQTMDENVISLIEREMNGAQGLAYMESRSPAGGMGTLTLTFDSGVNVDMAQVDVQNRIKRVEPKLPAIVRQLGVRVDKATSNFLMIVAFTGNDASVRRDDVADYVNRNVLPEIQRVHGVGNAQLFAAGRAMRVWIDPAKLEGFGLSAADVNAAIAAQNLQIASGSLGDLPSMPGQAITANIIVPGQLSTPEAFGNIVLRTSPTGAMLRLKDVAHIEVGIETYSFSSTLNGQGAVAVAVQLTASGNALATASAVRERMEQMAPFLPKGVQWSVPYDTSDFVKISIGKVVETLFEALGLVFLVMFIFLQNIRYTLIPTIVVPIALLGTLAVLLPLGFSINILTMFAMVLVIGIVVDDAIVVVENVERIMAEEGLAPLPATLKAMRQITGAVVGITVILVSVFVPLAMFGGATGNIYRQFAVVMAVAIAFSGFFALTLTPALCASMLKPIEKGHAQTRKTGLFGPFFNWFNHWFGRGTRAYESAMVKTVRHSARMAILYAVILGCAALLFVRLPTAFLPVEDQGSVIAIVQLPSGATQARTWEVMRGVEGWMHQQPEVKNMTGLLGFSFAGQGQNVGMAFVTLKDWSLRKDQASSAQALSARATRALAALRDGFVMVLTPPAIPELGTSNGFALRLQDKGGLGHDALLGARNQLLGMAAQSKVLTGVRPEGVEDAPQWQIDIDRDAAAAQGVSLSAIASTLSTALGSSYVSDFPNRGYMQRVLVQSVASHRMQPQDVLSLTVPNSRGSLTPLASVAQARWITGPMQLTRYNGYPSMSITGMAAAGKSTGDAMNEMQRLCEQLPAGIGYEWTGQSRDEKQAGSQSFILYAFSILAVFLCLAALYESWSIPLAVILVVPLGVLGVLAGVWLRGMPNDVYFQVGLITVIGLSAKNAILIVEFAKDLQASGMGVVKSALAAAHLRIRPILMTSLAFIFGVVPLFVAGGAGSASQREIGTGVLFGMLVGTVLAVFLVPVFFVIVRSFFKGSARERERFAEHAAHAGISTAALHTHAPLPHAPKGEKP